MNLRQKTKWDQLTPIQQDRLISAVSKERRKHANPDFHGWMRKGLLLKLVENHGFNRELIKETIEEIFIIEDGIVMAEKR